MGSFKWKRVRVPAGVVVDGVPQNKKTKINRLSNFQLIKFIQSKFILFRSTAMMRSFSPGYNQAFELARIRDLLKYISRREAKKSEKQQQEAQGIQVLTLWQWLKAFISKLVRGE